MDSLTLKEKIGQLVQLDGRFFGAEEVPTGPCAELGIEPWVAENAGSVLNVLGACNLVRRTEKGRLRRRGWGLRWEKAQKGGKGTNLRGFFED